VNQRGRLTGRLPSFVNVNPFRDEERCHTLLRLFAEEAQEENPFEE
jgi:hypothetical protein